MARLLDFVKTREDERVVEYIFGFRGDLDRRLVIEKASGTGEPLDGERDSNFGAVFVKIMRIQRGEERWPESGTYAA